MENARKLTVLLCPYRKKQFKGDYHHISEVIDQGMPVVMFDRVSNEILCDKVIIDDKLAAYEAVKSLIEAERNSLSYHLSIM
jgi:LacI family transcriptional regulator